MCLFYAPWRLWILFTHIFPPSITIRVYFFLLYARVYDYSHGFVILNQFFQMFFFWNFKCQILHCLNKKSQKNKCRKEITQNECKTEQRNFVVCVVVFAVWLIQIYIVSEATLCIIIYWQPIDRPAMWYGANLKMWNDTVYCVVYLEEADDKLQWNFIGDNTILHQHIYRHYILRNVCTFVFYVSNC